MKRIIIWATCLTIASAAGAGTLKIMPMGDSITKGFHGPASLRGSYRLELEMKLTEAEIDFDYVGDYTWGVDGLIDRDMQSVAGHPIETMTAEFGASVAAHQPDIVLVLAGTNNHWQDSVVEEFRVKYGDLIEMVHSNAPDARIIISTVPKFGCCRDPSVYGYWTPKWVVTRNTVTFPTMNEVISEMTALHPFVDCVDLYSRLDPQVDLTADWLHPNGLGHRKLAGLFFDAILEVVAPEALHPCYVDSCDGAGLDLNGNFVLDSCEADCDGDGLPNSSDDDGCLGTASADDADFDLDCDVDFIDLVNVLSSWGPCLGGGLGCPFDLDGNGGVGFGDIVTLLSFWGGHDEGPACIPE